MEDIQALASQCRVATPSDTVVHSECAFTFYSPFHDGGIVVNLRTFAGTIPELAAANGKEIFLRIVKDRREKEKTTEAPIKLAIGFEGGFDDDKYEVVTKHSVVVLEDSGNVVAELPYDESSKSTFPEQVVRSVESIVHHVGLAVQQDLTAWQDDEEIPVTKYYQDLPFVDNGVKISPDPKQWKCEKSGATENLWLNLSDGYIGGGRKNWDGSGGSNGALDHFQETGEKYPLVVKLGTITTKGSTVHADCFSYAREEDGPVKIPNLAELLAKRGIQVAGLQKTEKSTAELEVELNANYAFDAITESGSKLVSVTGPGLQGLQNLGNSCYLNSVVQCIAALPEFKKRYASTKPTISPFFDGVTPQGAPNNLLVQTAKLATALTSGAYAMPKEDLEADGPAHPKYRLAPRMFKHLIGKDHVDFRTGQQQDAGQFLQYLLEQLDRAEAKKNKEQTKTSSLFSFAMEDRLVCNADQKIKYKARAPETVWSLRLPMEKARVVPKADDEPELKKLKQDGKEDLEEKTIPTLSFNDCVGSWAAESTIDDYRWPHMQNSVHAAKQTTRFQNFPRYLWIQALRYELGPDWQPVKLEVDLDIPKEIDLNAYKANGPQDGEDLAPDVSELPAVAASSKPEISEAGLSQLMDMGFQMNGCKRALMAVGGSDVEAAMNWIFEHNMDPDFNDPIPEEGDAAASDGGADDAMVMSLVENLGCFTIDQVRAALKETNGAADRAADWLFSHMDDLEGAIASLETKNESEEESGSKVPLEDGDGKYKMIGIISHIGKNTGSGHYVAHVKRDGKWVIYNDEKVALSEDPPIPHAYLYLFQRMDTIGSPNPTF